MSAELKPLNSEEKKNTVNAALPAAFLEAIQEQANKAAKQASEESMKYAKILSQDIIDLVTTKMNQIAKNYESPSVLHVQIDRDPVKKLSKKAPIYLDRLVVNAKLGLNTLLVGPAGSGKTTAASLLAEALDLTFGHLNLTAGASETWLFGRQTPTGFVNGIFADLYEKGGVFLADEMDAADPNLLLSINTAISSNSFYNPIAGKTLVRHKDFIFIGAANTYGKGASATYVGRSRLDAATLDRFVIVEVDYNSQIEKQMCPDKTLYNLLVQLRKKLKDVGSSEVISTRAFDACYRQHEQGIRLEDIINSLIASWPADLKMNAKKLLSENKG